MIESQQDQPVFVLLPFVIGPSRLRSSQVPQLPPSLETHPQSDAFPGYEHSGSQLPVEPGLAPPWKQH
jgi:hypothetical protein